MMVKKIITIYTYGNLLKKIENTKKWTRTKMMMMMMMMNYINQFWMTS